MCTLFLVQEVFSLNVGVRNVSLDQLTVRGRRGAQVPQPTKLHRFLYPLRSLSLPELDLLSSYLVRGSQ